MGISSSTSSSSLSSPTASGLEGEHYVFLVNPQRSRPVSALSSSASVTTNTTVNGTGGNSASAVKKIQLGIDPRARILRRLDASLLWDAFLSSNFPSFALSPADCQALLIDATMSPSPSSMTKPKVKIEQAEIEIEIQNFIALQQELDPHRAIDFMSVLSASLFFSDQVLLERKVDQLFDWIALSPTGKDAFQFDDFVVALSSFERGISNALGRIACSEGFVTQTTKSWIDLAAPETRTQITKTITKVQFFEFCTNRQHVVRRLLEALSNVDVLENEQHTLQEVDIAAVESLISPSPGDEWMSNPAWKKTAEKMVPSAVLEKYHNAKPESSLTLQWVHGYRGYDCRNNVFFLTHDTVYFPAAALCIAQRVCNAHRSPTTQPSATRPTQQSYFNEHADDVLCLATWSDHREKTTTLCASGEIGKNPAVYLYSLSSDDGADGATFRCLSCFRGAHTKGVIQVAFSSHGKYLLTIGLEYSIALYGVDVNDKSRFGKLLVNGQGPKDKLMHCVALSSHTFLTCGEKHAIRWTFSERDGLLVKEEIKLGSFRNKVFLCASNAAVAVSTNPVNESKNCALLASSEGDLLYVPSANAKEKVATAMQIEIPSKGAFTGHSKCAINALSRCAHAPLILSGDKEGKVCVWRVYGESSKMALIWEFYLTGFTRSLTLEGIVIAPAVMPQSSQSGKNISLSGTQGVKEKRPAVRALCLRDDLQALVVGTHQCEIIHYELPVPLWSSIDDDNASVGDALSAATPLLSQSLVNAHFQNEVWGLAVRPITAHNVTEDVQYATVGDDGHLRLWSLSCSSQIACVDLGGVARCVDYSPDGLYLAIGFGAGNTLSSAASTAKKSTIVGDKGKKGSIVRNKEDGMVKVIRLDSPSTQTDTHNDTQPQSIVFTQVADIHEAKQWISCVRFSPDGTTLAVGSRDNSIYIYSIPNQYKRKLKFSKHNAGIANIDFSTCGTYLQSCCSAYEILFSNVQTGAQVTSLSTLQDIQWHTWTCTLGWPVIGIWSSSMDGSDINAVARSPSQRYLATADDFGHVNVFTYPCIQEKGAACNAYAGHSSHVTGVRWIALPTKKEKDLKSSRNGPFTVPTTDDFLISVGGEDKCVFQWQHTEQRTAKAAKSSSIDPEIEEEEGKNDAFEIPLAGGGDEFLAVKPWLGAIAAPSAWVRRDPAKLPPLFSAIADYTRAHNALSQYWEEQQEVQQDVLKTKKNILSPDNNSVSTLYSSLQNTCESVQRAMQSSGYSDSSAPVNDDLELAWVHGYRGFEASAVVHYATIQGSDRVLVYPAAGLVIVANPVKKTQRYFRGHTDDVIALAMFSKAEKECIVASAQCGPAKIFVWSVSSMQTLASLQSPTQKNITHLAFSTDGRLLVALSQNLSLTVSDWQSGTFLATTTMDKSTVFAVAVHSLPVQTSKSASTLQFLTVGDKAMKSWTLSGRNVSSTQVRAKAPAKVQLFFSVTQLCGRFFIGCEDGDVYIQSGDGNGGQKLFSPPYKKISVPDARGKKNNNFAVTAICGLHCEDLSCSVLACGTKSGIVTVWDATSLSALPTLLVTINLNDLSLGENASPILAKQVQNLSLMRDGTTTDSLFLAVGTRGCDLLELSVNLSSKTAELNRESSLSEGVITRGHCNDELWGLACHPFKPEFCTVGDDKTLRFFDLQSRSMTQIVPLGYVSRTVCYSHDGALLALGCGGRVGRGKEKGDGLICIYSLSGGCVKLTERQDAKQWVSDVKFSTDTRLLVAAAHDCKIYLYNVQCTPAKGKQPAKCELTLRSTFSKHNSVVTHIDLSMDGRFMRSNCAAYELLFCDTQSGAQITQSSELRDVMWKTNTCTLSWATQGIWRSGIDGSDINAVSRSHAGHCLAVADDFGKLSLYRFPALDVAKDKCVSFSGHSSHVMNTQWSCGDEFLVSVGGNDKCVLQWRHAVSDVESLKDATSSVRDAENKKKTTRFATDSVASAVSEKAFAGDENENEDDESDDDTPTPTETADDPFIDALSGGDESLAVKPWQGAVRAPKNVPQSISSAAPAVDVSLQWVHGYATQQRQRNNLFYTARDQVVYPAAALAVWLDRSNQERETSSQRGNNSNNHVESVLSTQSWTQRHMVHEEDVLCVAISLCRRFLATGQIASKSLKGKASVTIWDALECRMLSTMAGCHARGVLCVAFNDTSDRLVSVGGDDSHTHIVWKDLGGSWSRVQLMASVAGDKQEPSFAHWLSSQHSLAQSGDCHFLSGGGRTLSMWRVEGASLTKKQARLDKRIQRTAETFLAVTSLSHACYVGMSNGDILALRGDIADKTLSLFQEKAHSAAVFALAIVRERSLLVSGDRDGCVKVWSVTPTALQETCSFTHKQLLTLLMHSPWAPHISVTHRARDKAICAIDIQNSQSALSQRTLTMLIGVSGGDVYELQVPTLHTSSDTSSSLEKETVSFDVSKAALQRLTASHSSVGEVWGLAVHPIDRDIVATTGDDATLRVWSIKRNLCLSTQMLPRASRAVAWHADGRILAVGLTEAKRKKAQSGSTTKKNKNKNESSISASADNTADNEESSSASASQEDTPNTVLLFSVGLTPFTIMRRVDGCGTDASVSVLAFSAAENGTNDESHALLCVARETRIYGYALPSFSADPLTDQFPWRDMQTTLRDAPAFVFDKHSSRVLQLDFSLDGKYLQSTDIGNELLFYDLVRKAQETSMSKVAEYNGALSATDDDEESAPRQWATQTCVFGWAVQGIWPRNAYDSSEINAADRSLCGKFLATAEDSGKIRVLRFPCVSPGSASVTLLGHASHVSSVRWSTQHVLSVGGNDKCLFVWQVNEK